VIAHLSWHLVPSFLVLADELHFGVAAQRLGISRQTLAKRIGRLEDQLATPLLMRTTRRIELTKAGAELRSRAVPVLEAMDDAVRHVQRATDGRRLSLGISTDLTTDWDARIDAWLRERAKLAVLERRAPDDALRLVRAGRLDLVLLVGVAEGEPHSMLVGHEPTVVVFPDTHPAAGQATVRAGELRDLPVVVSDAGDDDAHRTAIQWLHGDVDVPYVVVPRIGTILAGLVHAARLHGAAAVVLSRGVELIDTTGLAALPIDPPLFLPVTVIGRPGLPDELLASLGHHLLGLPSP
jgi:DNA-binding transcriptional LysR family regulator